MVIITGRFRSEWRPILPHELVRPGGLPYFPAWKEFGHHRFDIDHGSSIDGVEFGNIEARAFDAEYAADGAPHAIGAVLAPLREDAHGRPVGIVCGDGARR